MSLPARPKPNDTPAVGRHLSTVLNGHMAVLDGVGICLILVKRDPPINPVLDDHGGSTAFPPDRR
jgi:hypothetical protein